MKNVYLKAALASKVDANTATEALETAGQTVVNIAKNPIVTAVVGAALGAGVVYGVQKYSARKTSEVSL